ncbi:MAG: hypothetical protein WBM07_08625 [Chitinivibrionales bacterium]
MRHRTRLCIAGALLFIATDCAQRKNIEFQCICTVGSDTLTPHRVKQLVPDSSSAPAQARILRALFECMYAGRIRASAPTGTGAQDKQLALDLAQQLSRQTGDAWTPEAALVLYDAAIFLKSGAAELRSMPEVLARSESLFTATVVFCDTGSKRKIISGKDSLFKAWRTQQTAGATEDLLSLLLLVPAPVARVVCDFLNSAETSSNDGGDARAMIKGLLYDSSAHRETETRRAPAPVPKDNSRAVLRYRSQQSIMDSIAVHVPILEALYKKHLKVHQAMAGKVWVTFQISAQGTVLSARLKTSSITEKDFLVPFQDYLIEKVRFKPVPEEVGPMAFTFPFEFSPEN